MRMIPPPLRLFVLFTLLALSTEGFAGLNSRPFLSHHIKTDDNKPKLILIGGCPGTGKSTFGMSVALDQGILKCISTDTVRAVMRSFVREDISPALHRSSYAPSGDGDDPVNSWKKTCSVLAASVQGLVDDSIARGQSLVLEGVHLVPSHDLIERWEEAGGVALGCLLTICDGDGHKAQLRRRGFMTGKGDPEEKKIKSFDRIRAIQDEMIRLAEESDWLLIEQRLEPDPLDVVSAKLWEPPICKEIPTETSQVEQQVIAQEKKPEVKISDDETSNMEHHVREEEKSIVPDDA